MAGSACGYAFVINVVPVNGRCSMALNVEGYLKTLWDFPDVIFFVELYSRGKPFFGGSGLFGVIALQRRLNRQALKKCEYS
tara:strand:- start:286 stop:528 length:243 start_codon:yes stop_codon:yes gene_type:complete